MDVGGGPSPGPHNWFRGAPITHYEAETLQALTVLHAAAREAALSRYGLGRVLLSIPSSFHEGTVWEAGMFEQDE